MGAMAELYRLLCMEDPINSFRRALSHRPAYLELVRQLPSSAQFGSAPARPALLSFGFGKLRLWKPLPPFLVLSL